MGEVEDILWAIPPVARIPHFMVYGLEAMIQDGASMEDESVLKIY